MYPLSHGLLRQLRRTLYWHMRRLVTARVNLGRGSRHGRLISIGVHVGVRDVSWTTMVIWDGVVPVAGPAESVRALKVLSCPLRVEILEGIVGVGQILVAPRVVSIGVWVCLLHGGRARWDRERWDVGCLLIVWVIGSAWLMGCCGIICPSTFRTLRQRVTMGGTYKMSHCSGVHIDHYQPQGIVSWVGEEGEQAWREAEKNR
jgi:hypothetical protein